MDRVSGAVLGVVSIAQPRIRLPLAEEFAVHLMYSNFGLGGVTVTVLQLRLISRNS